MTKAEVLKELRQQVEPVFKPDGLRYVRRREAFGRAFTLGCHFVHARLIVVGGKVKMEISASVRFEAIEQLFDRTSGIPDSLKGCSSTLWIGAENLTPWPFDDCHRVIDSPEDCRKAADAFVRFYREFAQRYFDDNSTIEAVDMLLNTAPGEHTAHCPNINRASYGVIAAALIGRDDFDQLVEQHRKALACFDNGFYLPPFDALVMDLRANCINRKDLV